MRRELIAVTLLLASYASLSASTRRITPLEAYEHDLRSRMRAIWVKLATHRAGQLAIGTVRIHFEEALRKAEAAVLKPIE